MHSATSKERRRSVETHPPFNVVNTPGGLMCKFVSLHHCALLIESVIGATRRLAIHEVHESTWGLWWVGVRHASLPQHGLCDHGYARVSLRYHILPLSVEIENSRLLMPRICLDISRNR
jgi:hypothetical protein